MTQRLSAAGSIFLHSGFRSGSTWFWHRFREARGTLAYYEPFHEKLAQLSLAHVSEFGPQHWPSGHPELAAPYFAEYRRGGGMQQRGEHSTIAIRRRWYRFCRNARKECKGSLH